MMRPFIRALTFLIILVTTIGVRLAHAVGEITLEPGVHHYAAAGELLLLEDPRASLRFQEVQSPDVRARFEVTTQSVPAKGVTGSAWWGRVVLHSGSDQPSRWFIDVGDSMLQWVDLYVVRADGRVDVGLSGSRRLPSANMIQDRNHLMSLDLAAGETVELILRVRSDYTVAIPLGIHDAVGLSRAREQLSSLHCIYIGLVLSMVTYNLFAYRALRDVSYVYYASTTLCILINTLVISGFTKQFGLDQWPRLNSWLFVLSYHCAFVSFVFFATAFLGRSNATLRYRNSITLICILYVMAYFPDDVRGWTNLNTAVGMIAMVWGFTLGVRQWRKGDKAAAYFCMGSGSVVVLGITFGLTVLGVLPFNVFTQNSVELGSAIEALTLSLGLAQKVRMLRDEKETAQAQLYETQRINLDIAKNYSRKLEDEVRQRTDELVSTQQKLVSSEKMAALGVFTAGMAHEINNPANFVAAGMQNAQAQLDQLAGFVGDLLDDEADPDIKGEFNRHFAKLGDSLGVIKTGVGRIEHVVRQLRATHPEGDVGMQPADVVDSLESAWRVLSPTVKTQIILSTQLDVRPQVSCMIAEINQVFLALLSNAAHAIEDALAVNGSDYKGEIKLASRESDGKLVITVSDNGIGIPADKLDKVFDPFFTTKTVGRGAGLGLSMASDVLRKHGGTLEAESAEGQGSIFTLSLPLHV